MTFEEYYYKFETMQRWANNDLVNSTIKGRANFLVAMGIFNYIEMLGGFYYPEEKRASSKRFNYAFNNFFSQPYKEIFDSLKTITKNGAYDVLRCGMSHEYCIKSYSTKNESIEIAYTIFGVDDEAAYAQNILSLECGIEILSLKENKYHLRIYNPRFIYDLNQAFETLKSYIRSNPKYREKFLQRCKEIHLENFN
jgi:hypothetical protein